MKRTRIERHTPLARTGRIASKPRTKAERERVYGPEERGDWLRSHPCLACGFLPTEVCHVKNGGMSRKGDASQTVPLCHAHHMESHRGVKSFESRHAYMLSHLTLVEWAAWYENAWRRFAGLEPLSSIVPPLQHLKSPVEP